ncbi:ParB/RepB/Spo0J family partition protein [Rhizobium sp. P007]|uniref:ParB/RepB/Spo0J family partition protein n=1 Tax=Rhizobium sp. P007 TaxID=285908 RepID=UPI001157EABA|nr:ParB/RepB/Spo0J family partition protein [Rhizobium sp. P007]CAD7058264.1 chromosome partitioning protein ParB [Rhizobium sp. P007]
MTTVGTIAVADIRLTDRLRPVDLEHARAIAFSIEQHGLINPITVRKTPAAKKGKYTLIAGAHRLEAFRILARDQITAIIVNADGDEAEALEIAENFFRNDLSTIDRAAFGERFRELWEKNVGPITRGPKKAIPLNLAVIFQGRFEEAVAKRLGVSHAAARRLHRIATGIHPTLRDKLRGTPEADNESFLLKLVKIGLDDHVRIAAAMDKGASVHTAISFTKTPKETVAEQDKLLQQFKAAWTQMDAATRQKALASIDVDTAA